MKPLICPLVVAYFLSGVTGGELITDELQALKFLYRYNKLYSKATNVYLKKAYTYWTNSTDFNRQEYVAETTKLTSLSTVLNAEARQFDLAALPANIRRRLKLTIGQTTSGLLDGPKGKKLAKIKSDMLDVYTNIEVCLSPTRCLSDSTVPTYNGLMWQSRDPKELADLWAAYHDRTGTRLKDLYVTFVELINEAARKNGYADYGDGWRSEFEQSNFEEDVLRLYDGVYNLYRELHRYVKWRLKKIFPENVFPKSGHIPAHLFGDLGRARWTSSHERVKPRRNKHLANITQQLHKRRFTVRKMYDQANDFYKSLGFRGLPESVWNNSVMVKPKNVPMQCNGVAFDMNDKRDFRLAMCAEVSEDYMYVIYHEMGHIIYFQEYAHHPVYQKGSANEAFHEAIGDIMSMSFKSPEYMKKIGFVRHTNDIDETLFLLESAMHKVSLIPYALVVDLWRWGVFNGSITPENYNKEFWRLSCKYRGISPPTDRSKADMDAGGLFHVAGDYTLIRYFVGGFLEFQLYEAACRAKGHKGPLYMCDISDSKLAGAKFKNLMGAARQYNWWDMLQQFTGFDYVRTESITNYYQELFRFMTEEDNPEPHEWNPECDGYPSVA